MPRIVKGTSPLGSQLNDIGSGQDGVNISKVKYKTGIIIDFPTVVDGKKVSGKDNPKADGLYEFKVKLDDGTITGYLPYVKTANELAFSTGHPKDFLGKYCQIFFQGQSSNRGKIMSIVDDRMDTSTSGAANQLQITGAAFAPPGSGMI